MLKQPQVQAVSRSGSKPLFVLGIMSGTSIGSVDYALCSIGEKGVVLKSHWQSKFPRLLQDRLQHAAQGMTSSHQLAQLHHDLGRFYAGQAAYGMGEAKLDLVGLHGQTVFHNPAQGRPATFQLGEPAYLVEKLRVPVVSNFRAADMAAGGQGAPLATLFHKLVFADRSRHVCVNNLGGISNVTSIDWREGREPRIIAFDTGPANMLIDLAIRRLTGGRKQFDENGTWARRGVVSEGLLGRWLQDPYFAKTPPKSTGRELFGESFLEPALTEMNDLGFSKFDMLATLTEFTACSLALSYRLHLKAMPHRVILAGGGAANSHLVASIHKQLLRWNSNVQLETSEQLGWPIQSIEPAAFALLAYYRLRRMAGNIPSTTGAKRSALLGQITEP